MYSYTLPPARRCTACSVGLFEAIKEDPAHIRAVLVANERKLRALKSFLVASRNKELNTKILDPEIQRVLT